MKQLILASQSPRRKMLLEQIGVPFMVIPPDLEETMSEDKSPMVYVQELSVRKALHVAGNLKASGKSSFVVMAADTIVVLNGHILGKPRGEEEASRMLDMLSGNWHEVMTGITLVDGDTGRRLSHVETTRVKIRPLTERAILQYVKSREPLDKAGAYGIQGLGALLVEKIEGCYFNVVGLPLYRASVMLARMGIETLLEKNV